MALHTTVRSFSGTFTGPTLTVEFTIEIVDDTLGQIGTRRESFTAPSDVAGMQTAAQGMLASVSSRINNVSVVLPS